MPLQTKLSDCFFLHLTIVRVACPQYTRKLAASRWA